MSVDLLLILENTYHILIIFVLNVDWKYVYWVDMSDHKS